MELGFKGSFAVIVIVLVVWGIMAANKNKNQEATTGQDQNKMVAGDTIKIGYIGPLTGEVASIGDPGLAGAKLAIKEINDAGGLLGKKVELVSEDDKCSSDGINAMTKLVNVDKVVAITGPDCSASAGSALPVAQNAKVPTILRWASAAKLTGVGNFIFRIYPSDAFQSKYAAGYIYSKLAKKNAAVIYVKNDWGQGMRDGFVEAFSHQTERIMGIMWHPERNPTAFGNRAVKRFFERGKLI